MVPRPRPRPTTSSAAGREEPRLQPPGQVVVVEFRHGPPARLGTEALSQIGVIQQRRERDGNCLGGGGGGITPSRQRLAEG